MSCYHRYVSRVPRPIWPHLANRGITSGIILAYLLVPNLADVKSDVKSFFRTDDLYYMLVYRYGILKPRVEIRPVMRTIARDRFEIFVYTPKIDRVNIFAFSLILDSLPHFVSYSGLGRRP